MAQKSPYTGLPPALKAEYHQIVQQMQAEIYEVLGRENPDDPYGLGVK